MARQQQRRAVCVLSPDLRTLLIGVNDERNEIGLDLDYELLGKEDSHDAYEKS